MYLPLKLFVRSFSFLIQVPKASFQSCKQEQGPSLKRRFPVSSRTATTEVELLELILVDQIGNWDSLNKPKLPSDTFSSEEYISRTGISLFATQTGVCSETLPPYHMPM
ncbi:hypothetical protein ES288_D02G228900v1 [Gossypium darwinii]|uniref:Uncharacterized protein n=1 Tax=Gossypium darwinii TaxID=34276 RepID=A0A5D2DHM1_GOSDA|nr:hypothetical protein ES288_D02G228900v1 [Gossypium darwinii]